VAEGPFLPDVLPVAERGRTTRQLFLLWPADRMRIIIKLARPATTSGQRDEEGMSR